MYRPISLVTNKIYHRIDNHTFTSILVFNANDTKTEICVKIIIFPDMKNESTLNDRKRKKKNNASHNGLPTR